MESQLKPGLYIVSTPIGNLGDITLRALDVLKKVDFVYCEDKRVSSKLLSHYQIKVPLRSYHEFNADKVRPEILEAIVQGQSIALISDAGTPLISDPGYKLIRACQEANLFYTALPGACSLINGMVLSGLPVDAFYFAGFLPEKKGQRSRLFTSLKDLDATLVFLSTAKKVAAHLRDLYESLGNREIVIAREMTKFYEEVIRGCVSDIISRVQDHPLKGEIVLLIKAQDQVQNHQIGEDILTMISQRLSLGQTTRQIVQDLQQEKGLTKKDLYDHIQKVKNAEL